MFLQKISALSALLLVLGGGNSLAQTSPLTKNNALEPAIQLAQNQSQNRPGRDRQREGLAEALNLTEDQKERVQAIRQDYRSEIQQKQQLVQTIRQELNDLFATNASAEQLRDKQRELSQLRTDINTLNFESMLEVREILTLEQREQFRNLMQQRGGNRSRRSDR